MGIRLGLGTGKEGLADLVMVYDMRDENRDNIGSWYGRKNRPRGFKLQSVEPPRDSQARAGQGQGHREKGAQDRRGWRCESVR